MLSTFPAMMTPDCLFGNSFPPFEGGFPTFETPETPFVFPPFDQPFFNPVENLEPVLSNSGSDNSNPITSPVDSNAGSDKSNEKNKNSSSVESIPVIIDERKRRRMISNRESARRSRMRKQNHLENLRNQLNRLRVTNRELKDRLRFTNHHCQIITSDNDRIHSESAILRQRLWDIRQVLLVRQLQQEISATSWPCNNFTSSTTSLNEEIINPQSLIT